MILRIGRSAGLGTQDREYIVDKLESAQRLVLSSDFVEASIDKLATNETVVKAKAWFKLIHNPMFMEWQLDRPEAKSFHMAVLLWSEEGSDGIECILFDGMKGNYDINHATFYPDTIRLDADNNVIVDTSDYMRGGAFRSDGTTFIDTVIPYCIDFLIRLNSTAITDISAPEDLTAINRKRVKSGKKPLYSYHVVDLKEPIKRDWRAISTQDPEGHLRLHWRRGHFKMSQNWHLLVEPTSCRPRCGRLRREALRRMKSYNGPRCSAPIVHRMRLSAT